MKKIPLTNGKDYTIVDDEDYDELIKISWYYLKTHSSGPYAINYKSKKTIYMHRFIMKAKKGKVCDHINHNTLDNRKSNLRVCTSSQNNTNCKKHIDNKSGFKGVYWEKSMKRWRVDIKHPGGRVRKNFKDEIEAAKFYNKEAVRVFGEFAYINEI